MSSPTVPRTFQYSNVDGANIRHAIAEHGFVRIRKVFDVHELALVSREVSDVVSQLTETHEQAWFSPRLNGGLVLQRVSRINSLSTALVRDFLNARQIRKLGAWIFETPESRVRIADGSEGSDGIVLVVKDPKNVSEHKELRWHRDAKFTQHLAINPFVNCGLALDRSDALRGSLVVIPGSHRSNAFDWVEETTTRVAEELSIEADPGDVVVHRSDLLHRSGPHRVEGEVRRILYANVFHR